MRHTSPKPEPIVGPPGCSAAIPKPSDMRKVTVSGPVATAPESNEIAANAGSIQRRSVRATM